MSAAGFVLAINIFVAALFCAAFGAVAMRFPAAHSARCLTLAYFLGIVNAALEWLLPLQADPRLLSIVMFAVSLGAFLACVVGLARHYSIPTPRWWLIVLGSGATLVLACVTYLPTNALADAFAYQLPFFAAHLLAAVVVAKAPRKAGMDWTLLVFLLLSSLQFLAKPFMALELGGSGPHTYLQGLYGAFSQLLIAFLLISNGVLMLLIIVRDMTAAIVLRGDTDELSGLFNRRGFEDRVERLLAWAARERRPLALVVADLDHFKQINDTLGHEAGDQVIRTFSGLLRDTAPANSVVGRLGGEEFAVLIPNGSSAVGRLLAEAMRQALHAGRIVALPPAKQVTASFGVTVVGQDEHFSDALRRADSALYQAKRTGRDRVCVADPAPTEPNAVVPRSESA